MQQFLIEDSNLHWDVYFKIKISKFLFLYINKILKKEYLGRLDTLIIYLNIPELRILDIYSKFFVTVTFKYNGSNEKRFFAFESA